MDSVAECAAALGPFRMPPQTPLITGLSRVRRVSRLIRCGRGCAAHGRRPLTGRQRAPSGRRRSTTRRRLVDDRREADIHPIPPGGARDLREESWALPVGKDSSKNRLRLSFTGHVHVGRSSGLKGHRGRNCHRVQVGPLVSLRATGHGVRARPGEGNMFKSSVRRSGVRLALATAAAIAAVGVSAGIAHAEAPGGINGLGINGLSASQHRPSINGLSAKTPAINGLSASETPKINGMRAINGLKINGLKARYEPTALNGSINGLRAINGL